MSKRKQWKFGVIAIFICLLACSLGSFALAASEPVLNSLTIYEKGSSSKSQRVDIEDNMVVEVGQSCDTITMKATASSGCDITINGTPWSSSLKINVYDGTTPVEIKVENSDGASKTYHLDIKKTNNQLEYFKIINGSQTILEEDNPSDSKTYRVSVPSDVSSLKVEAEAQSNEAVITYSPANADNGFDLLAAGKKTTLQIFVRSDASSNSTRTYEVEIERVSTSASDSCRLSSLEVLDRDDNDVLVNFNSSTLDYDVVVPYTSSSVKIKPRTEDSGATVTVNGETIDSGDSLKVDAPTGTNTKTVQVVVTAANRVDKQTYTLRLKMDQSGNSDRTLKSLSVKHGSSTSTLSPAFCSSLA